MYLNNILITPNDLERYITMSLLDLDSELEQSIDGTIAAPDFVEPPAGKYRLAVK